MHDRLKLLREELTLTQTAFGEKIGATRPMIAAYESGKVAPPEPLIRLICREFNVSYLWLTEGMEPMYVPEESSVVARLHNVMHGDNEFAKRVLREFSTMPREAWLELEAFLLRLTGKK